MINRSLSKPLRTQLISTLICALQQLGHHSLLNNRQVLTSSDHLSVLVQAATQAFVRYVKTSRAHDRPARDFFAPLRRYAKRNWDVRN